MVFAIIYTEGADVVATYTSEEEATSKLADFIAANPSLVDEIGLRRYDGGRPVGPWISAADVLAETLAQPHLV